MKRGVYLLWHEGIVHSWWVLLFATLCFAGYESAARALDRKATALQGEVAAAEKQLAAQKARLEELQRKIRSQTDAAYVELVLIQKLGVVPRGQQKVYFEPVEAR